MIIETSNLTKKYSNKVTALIMFRSLLILESLDY